MNTYMMWALGGVLACALGCEDPAEDRGTAPAISALQLDDGTVVVGELTTLMGQLTIMDPDADAAALQLSLSGPGGTTDLPSTPIAGVAGQVETTARFQLVMQAPMAGRYTLSVEAVDAAGGVSNRLTAPIEVTAEQGS
jgi:hypothetical protein